MGGVERLYLQVSELPAEQITIQLPGSKSISNRLLVMRQLSGNSIEIERLSEADDTVLLERALNNDTGEMWLGDAGTALRFGLAWASVSKGERVMRGSARLSQRPIRPLVEALRLLGADIHYLEKEGFLPLKVTGKNLQRAVVEIEASESSQFTSALMLIAPYVAGGLEISRKGHIVSEPYVAMTRNLMVEAGAEVSIQAEKIVVEEGAYQETTFEVEPDWSAASYFYAVCALSGNAGLRLQGLRKASSQGDAVVADLFRSFGVQTRYTAAGAQLSHTGFVEETPVIDFLKCPDLAQTVAVVAAGLRHPCRLEGLQTLRVKETDRIAALSTELAKCGVTCDFGPDFLELKSFSKPEETPHISTYGDHRMAMAFAPLALVLGGIVIESPKVVSKSFPGFWVELEKVGIGL